MEKRGNMDGRGQGAGQRTEGRTGTRGIRPGTGGRIGDKGQDRTQKAGYKTGERGQRAGQWTEGRVKDRRQAKRHHCTEL